MDVNINETMCKIITNIEMFKSELKKDLDIKRALRISSVGVGDMLDDNESYENVISLIAYWNDWGKTIMCFNDLEDKEIVFVLKNCKVSDEFIIYKPGKIMNNKVTLEPSKKGYDGVIIFNSLLPGTAGTVKSMLGKMCMEYDYNNVFQSENGDKIA